ncbi:MAG: molybdenum cofactor biosynthesis protein B, partial [Prochlorococcus sp.]
MVLAIALLTISDSRSLGDDPSGDALQQRLKEAGHHLQERALCPDNRYAIRAIISRWLANTPPPQKRNKPQPRAPQRRG